MDFSEILTHLGEDRSDYFNAIAPPIIQTSNFKFDNMAALKAAFGDERRHHLYTRGNNPTATLCATKIAALEGAEDALLVGSGAAAISNSVLANVQAGDHIVCVRNAYSWANRLLQNFLPRFGIETTFVDGRHVTNFEQAIRPNTRLFYLESPTSLLMELQDLPAVVALARQHRILTVMDNSYGSPLNNHPLQWGVDITHHSATKYIGGHSDTVAGVICSSKVMIDKIFQSEMMTLGNIISPMNAWLLTRSLRTLPMRIQHAAQTTQQIIAFLEKHPKVAEIIYPHHPSFPQFELAKIQMPQPMPLFSVAFKDATIVDLEAFADRLQRFLIAVSWGGHESLVLPVAVDWHGVVKPIVRFSIGFESAEWLLEDLENGLKHL